jgi:hypothetical protein
MPHYWVINNQSYYMLVLWSSELLVCIELTTEVQCRKLLFQYAQQLWDRTTHL